MWNKIKAFLQNRIVITVEFILVGGILGAISAFILYIIGMTKK